MQRVQNSVDADDEHGPRVGDDLVVVEGGFGLSGFAVQVSQDVRPGYVTPEAPRRQDVRRRGRQREFSGEKVVLEDKALVSAVSFLQKRQQRRPAAGSRSKSVKHKIAS